MLTQKEQLPSLKLTYLPQVLRIYSKPSKRTNAHDVEGLGTLNNYR